MIDQSLELRGGLGGAIGRKICQPANVDRIQLAELCVETNAAEGEIEAGSRLQRLNRRCRITRAPKANRPRSVGRYMNCTDVSSG